VDKKLDDLYTPRYIKIAEDLKEKINSGLLKPGERIYSEKEIMEKYVVSSTTARKSIDVLRNENLIERIQGKGTFVLHKKVLRSLKKVISFTENMEKQNVKPSVKILEKQIIEGFTEYHEKLNLSKGEKILKMRRLKFGDGTPLLIDTRYISLKYCPDIYNQDLSVSLYKIYEQYNIKITHSKQFLELTFLDGKSASLLHCKKGDPAIYIEGTLYMEDFTPIEYEEDLWNGRVFRFYVEASL